MKITGLAAGGDGVARDDNGRVTFVPLTVPGDDVRVALTKETKSFARGDLAEILTPSPDRVTPPCPHFLAGCGGCQWQHVAMSAQLAAKHAIVTTALRKVAQVIEPIASPAPPLGWRRRARFHVEAGKLGLYHRGTNKILPLASCPQLEPALEQALELLSTASKHSPMPDGDIAMLIGHKGEIVVAFDRPWRAAAQLVGQRGIVGVLTDDQKHGTTVIEIEPGLHGSPWDFAQASAAGNAALIALVRTALGKGPGVLLELYAGAGNFTRSFAEDGWTVTPTDGATPPQPPPHFIVGAADKVLAGLKGPVDALVLDPPRAGAPEAIAGIVRMQPKTIVYVSCDPATLARDLEKLVGYRVERVWPIDLMPQTSHVEVVVRLVADAAVGGTRIA